MSHAAEAGKAAAPREKDRLRQENGRAQAKAGTLRWVLALLSALLAVSMILNVAYAHALIYTFPLKRWVWTSDARAVCDATPLSYPSVSAARVKDFAAGAAVELNSFDYLNHARVLNAAIDKYMTAAGRVAFLDTLQDSGIIQAVEKSYVVLEAVTTGRPYIKDEGIRPEDKRYYWRVQVPVRLFYYVLGDRKPEDRVMTAVVVRVDPSPNNQNGIAVDGITSSQMTTNRPTEF